MDDTNNGCQFCKSLTELTFVTASAGVQYNIWLCRNCILRLGISR